MTPPSAPQRSLFSESSDGLQIPAPKPEAIRQRLRGVLGLLRESHTFPWSPAQFRSWRIVFPQMTSWLPDNEARELRDAFFRELDRWGDEARDKDED